MLCFDQLGKTFFNFVLYLGCKNLSADEKIIPDHNKNMVKYFL